MSVNTEQMFELLALLGWCDEISCTDIAPIPLRWNGRQWLLTGDGAEAVLKRMIELKMYPNIVYKAGVNMDDFTGLYWDVEFRPGQPRPGAYAKELPQAVALAALAALEKVGEQDA